MDRGLTTQFTMPENVAVNYTRRRPDLPSGPDAQHLSLPSTRGSDHYDHVFTQPSPSHRVYMSAEFCQSAQAMCKAATAGTESGLLYSML
jgi:hypothetical protein